MTSRPRLPAAPYPAFDGSQACAAFPFTMFFPAPGCHPREYTQAKAVCFDCPFRAQCVAYSLSHDIQGIWGGMTERDRQSIRDALGVGAQSVAPGDQEIVRQRIDRFDNGLLPDTEIARQVGCSDRTVQRRRAAREAA